MAQATGAAPRMAWIDICKGAMILLVVLLHSSSYFKAQGGEVPPFVTAATAFFAPMRMPTLIFLSGLMASRGLRKGARGFLLHRLRILLWPYLVWTVLWALASDHADRLIEPEWWLGGWYLWFLLFIMAFSIVAALVPLRFHLVAAAYAFLASLACEDGTKYGERLLFFLALFLVGSFLGRDRERMEAWLGDRLLLWTLAPAIVAVCLYSAIERTIRYSPHDALSILIVVAGVLAAGIQFARRHPLPLLQAMGRHSLTIYLVHMPVIAITLRCLPLVGISSFAPTFTMSVALGLAASAAMIAARRRYRAVDALFHFPGA